jgi:hypothetical protein
MRQEPSHDTPANDPLEPFEKALKARVPSRAELLAEAKAFSARQRRRKQALAGGLSVLALGVGRVDRRSSLAQ